jgi:pilus assembly protein CpaB
MEAKPKTAVIIGIVAVVVAGIASMLLYQRLKGQEEMMKKAVATESIVVANEQISVGGTIKPGQVKMANWPKAELPAGSFTNSEQVVGRTAIDRFVPGDPIVEVKLIPKEGQTGILSYKRPEGQRAMTVAVAQVSGVAGFITPGNMVDVVLTIAPEEANKKPISKIVLQNVPVLATGQIISQEKKDEKPVVVPTVTMDVTPEDAEKLAIASTQGRLQLVLRRAGDADVAKTTGATVSKVLTAASTATPTVITKTKTAAKTRPAVKAKVVEGKPAAPEKPQVVTVEILRGNKRSEESFKVEKE